MMELRYSFDPERFYLGTLCKNGHRWPSTDQSLRKNWRDKRGHLVNHCIGCIGRKNSNWLISFTDAQAMGFPEGWKFGKPCKGGHLWEGHEMTLKDSFGKCPDCERIRKTSEKSKETRRAWTEANRPRINQLSAAAQQRRRLRVNSDPVLLAQAREQRKEAKRRRRERLRERGLTARGTQVLNPVAQATLCGDDELARLLRALRNGAQSPSVAQLVADAQRIYRRENKIELTPEEIKERARFNHRYRYLTDPDYVLYHRQKSKRRKALLKSRMTQQLTGKQVRARFTEFGNCCAYCGDPGDPRKLHIEHVVPISKGGHHVLGNIVPACQDCNFNKATNEAESWYRSQSFFCEKRWRKICRVLDWHRAPVGQLSLL